MRKYFAIFYFLVISEWSYRLNIISFNHIRFIFLENTTTIWEKTKLITYFVIILYELIISKDIISYKINYLIRYLCYLR